MALVYADRVKVRSRTVGTGTFILENTVSGFQNFSVIGDGNETYYGIVDAAGNWEIGQGTYTAIGNTLSRDQVISSSNNNQLVDFLAGGKNVYTTIPSSLVAQLLGIEIDPIFSAASIITADIKGSVFADDSSMLIDGTEGKVIGPIASFDGTNSVIMDPSQGLLLASTGLIDIQGAAGAQIGIGSGTSGDVYLGNGSNNIIINGILNTSTITSDDSSAISIIPQTQFNSNIIIDGDLVFNGDNRIQANTGINLIPNQTAESFGSTLNIQGIPGGEGFPGVVIATQSAFISIGPWTMFSDGGLYSAPLSVSPDFPIISTIYVADGTNWDPANYQSGTPYPVFYDGNDFLPMTAAPSP